MRIRLFWNQTAGEGVSAESLTRLIVEADALIVDRGRMSARYSWSAFQGVEVAKNAVILPIDNGIGVIVPASAFTSDAERFEFAAMIAKRLEAQKLAAGVPKPV